MGMEGKTNLKDQDQKDLLLWILMVVCGIASLVLAALAPGIRWYSLGQVLVSGGWIYCVWLSAKRKKRMQNNLDLLRKMGRRQKEKFVSLDAKECKNLHTLSKQFQYLFVVCLMINIYCVVYRYVIGPNAASLMESDHQGWVLSWVFCGISALLLAGFDALGYRLMHLNLVYPDRNLKKENRIG